MTDNRRAADAILARDAAVNRLRRVTLAAVAAATGVAGLLAGVAASSTHGHSVVARHAPQTVRAVSATQVPAPTATVAVAEVPQPGGVAPASAPLASSAPPVVVSGGS